MKWIFHSASNDLMVLYLPALITIFLTTWLAADSAGYAVLAFFTLFAIDAGHGYATGWRLIRSEHDRRVAIYVFAGLLLMTLLWLYLGGAYFWSFVVYFTFYHHIRQIYGVSAWYQRFNGSLSPGLAFFVQALCLLPLIAFHFRSDLEPIGIYSQNDIFMMPNPAVFKFLVGVNVLIAIVWIGYEIQRGLRNQRWEWNLISSIFLPAALSTYCLYFGGNFAQVSFPLLVFHGFTYLALVAGYTPKTLSKKIPLFVICLGVGLTALLAGLWESWLSEAAYLPSDMTDLSTLQKVPAALLVVPALWHYFVDGWIWKSRNPVAAQIYRNH